MAAEKSECLEEILAKMNHIAIEDATPNFLDRFSSIKTELLNRLFHYPLAKLNKNQIESRWKNKLEQFVSYGINDWVKINDLPDKTFIWTRGLSGGSGTGSSIKMRGVDEFENLFSGTPDPVSRFTFPFFVKAKEFRNGTPDQFYQLHYAQPVMVVGYTKKLNHHLLKQVGWVPAKADLKWS